MSFVIMHDPEAFAARVWAFIEDRIECNVLATVLINARNDAYGEVSSVFAFLPGPRGQVRAVAMRVPPHPLLISRLGPEDADRLIEQWLEADPSVPGATGSPTTVRALSAAWSRRTRGSTRVRMREAMHVLERVVAPPHPTSGELRPAREQESALLAEWLRAFILEAGLSGAGQSERTVRERIKRDRLYVWDDGSPVSVLGDHPPVAGVVRIGPVYTPPEHRRRGYAGHAVAELSRRGLTAGARKCMLFTDLANPTSNKIYAEVGFRAVGDWEDHEFLGDAEGP